MLGLFVAEVVVSIGVAGVLSIAMVGELFAAPVRSTGSRCQPAWRRH